MAHKNVIITGASGNLGKAVVNEFLQQNAAVIGVVHHKTNNATTSENYKEHEVDLADETLTENFIESISKERQHVDSAILTAGGFGMGKLGNTSLKDLEQQYRLNFITAYNVTRPLFEQMKKQGGGKLFFIGSEPGMNTKKGKSVVAYSLSKSQLFQLANIMNAESKDTGVQAHVVIPSTIDTPENRKSVPDANFSKWEKPADIAKIIYNYATNKEKTKQEIIIKEELENL